MRVRFTSLFVLFSACAASVWGQSWPFNASDAVYGLRSRADSEPGFVYTPSPADWRDVNIYQLFTDRFADGDAGNNQVQPDWFVGNRPFPENRNFHHGGDWKGLRQNLDYLSGMGVNAIWMSGVQMNAQGKDPRFTPYHMYHPTDFFRVDPTMGTFADLKELIDACHARGIYVILDVVINHTADLNGLWGNNQLEDKQYWGGGNGSHGWWSDRRHAPPFDQLHLFHNHGTIQNWDSYPEYLLGQFKGTDDLRTEDAQVQAWLDLAFKNLIDATDCDGFRVDAIKHVSFDWIMAWADSIRRHAAWRGKQDFILFGEYFTYDNQTLARYCQAPGYAFNSALFFPMSQTFKSVFVDGAGTGNLTQALNARSQYGEGADRLVTFIDNHDVNRIGLQAGGNVGHIEWIMPPALTFLYTATPVPCLFYGTEHAFQQGGHWNGSAAQPDYDDADWQRETLFDRGFQPGPAQGNKLAATDAPLYRHIAALNRARAAHISLRRGSFQERWQSGGRGPYAFTRAYGEEESLVALNTADQSVSLNPQVAKPNGTVFVNALDPEETLTVSDGRLSFSLSGKQSKIFVAGAAAPALWVRGTHSTPAPGSVTPRTPVFFHCEAGPADTVTSARAGVSANGGLTWELLSMTATNWNSEGGTWYTVRLGQYPADTELQVYIEIEDADGRKHWDNANGLNHRLTVGPDPSLWIQGTHSFPVDGEATAEDDLWVNSEAGPSNRVAAVEIRYSVNDGAWQSLPLAVNPAWGSATGRWYNGNLGQFPAGSQLRYAVAANDGEGAEVVDDQGGAFHRLTVRAAPGPVLWLGNTRHSPEEGVADSNSVVRIQTQTWPTNLASAVFLVYTLDQGANWAELPLSPDGNATTNALWLLDLGPFPDGTELRYALRAEGAGQERWDNNGGQDFQLRIGARPVRMAWHSPQVADGNPGTQPDNPDDLFDLDLSGGALLTLGDAGFGDFGSVYVNVDGTNLYLGATGVSLPPDSDNNAYVLFISGGNGAANSNLWDYDLPPEGPDKLHNLAFQPPVQFALLLGDVWGDGSSTAFRMYRPDGFEFGQGLFRLDPSDHSISPVPGARLSQFGGYGPDNRLAAHWECVLPLAALGVADAQSLTNLFLSGLMVTGDTDGNNRFISGKTLGAGASLGNGESPDAFGNFAYSFVNLAGAPVLPPALPDTVLDVPRTWIREKLGENYTLTRHSNQDLDPLSDREEFFAGTDPAVADAFHIHSFLPGELGLHKVGSHSVAYRVETADAVDPLTRNWNWVPRLSLSRTDGWMDGLPSDWFDTDGALFRVQVQVPPPENSDESVSVGASPAGANFSADQIQVLLSVQGVNVQSATYTVQGQSPVPYADGDLILFGAGMTVGESRSLTLRGETGGGLSQERVYTFTKVPAHQFVSWTGNVQTTPPAGEWDEGEDLVVSMETAPLNAAVNVGIVFSTNGGADWTSTPLTAGSPNASNDTWSVNLGSHPAGTTLQFALVAYDSHVNATWNNNGNNNYSVSVNRDDPPGGSKPYSTNPGKGQYRAAGITIDGANTGGEWDSTKLIALDMGNDDPRTLGGNWTLHEAPIDFTHLWACWDDANLYLAWQLVDLTDVLDPANAGSGDPINRNDGILLWAVLDTGPGGSRSDMWAKSNTWDGVNVPDIQVYMAGSLWQSYLSQAVGGVFPVDDGGVNYRTTTAWGMQLAKSASLVATEVWGVQDADSRFDDPGSLRDFRATGHARTDRDSFYEMKIPLTVLGLTRAQLESSGLGVMIGAGGQSAIDSIPHDESTLDTHGVEVWNSSKEWSDADSFTAPFARVGN